MTTGARAPKNALDRLTLPKFELTPPNGDGYPHGDSCGGDSSHLTLTNWTLFNFDPRDPPILRIMPDINCAIIYCEGAMREGRTRRFAPTSVSRMEATFHTGDQPCSIPTMIGLPIWMRSYHHDLNVEDRVNTVATWLHVIGELDAEGFGFATKQWLDNAVVVRVDGKDLLPQHLEVLSFFCRHVFEQIVGVNVGMAGLSEDANMRKMQKAAFRKMVSRRSFMEYYGRYCSEKVMLDEQWRHLPSPYYDNVVYTEAKSLTNGNYQVNGNTLVVNGDAREPPEPRRSCRPTRLPAWMLDESPLTPVAADDESRGRRRKRRSSDSDYA